MMNLVHWVSSIFIQLKIPTLLALGILILGLGAGVVLVMQNQTLTSEASPSEQPLNITVSSIDDQNAAISWQTNSPTTGFVTFGQNSSTEKTALDVQDTTTKPRTTHYVQVSKLIPHTTYQFKVISGKSSSETQTFTTASSSNKPNSLPPIIGTVLENAQPVKEGVVYLNISGAIPQSAPISSFGNFTIPLAKVYQADLTNILPLSENTVATLKVVVGSKTSTGTFNLSLARGPLPPINLGEEVIFTSPSPSGNLSIYDLNTDSKINAADYAMAQKNKGKKVNNILIDEKYLKELTSMVNSLNP